MLRNQEQIKFTIMKNYNQLYWQLELESVLILILTKLDMEK